MNREEHYAEAERLLERSKELTAEYIKVESAATPRKIDLEMLHRQLTDRAHVHALLASVPVTSARRFDNSMAGTHPWWEEA